MRESDHEANLTRKEVWKWECVDPISTRPCGRVKLCGKSCFQRALWRNDRKIIFGGKEHNKAVREVSDGFYFRPSFLFRFLYVSTINRNHV